MDLINRQNTGHSIYSEFLYFARSTYTTHTSCTQATYAELCHNDSSDVLVVMDGDDEDKRTSPAGSTLHTQGPSWDLIGNSPQSPVNLDDISDSDGDAITLTDAFPSSSVTTRQAAAKVPRPEVSEKEEVFLAYDKPNEQQSPTELSSGSSDSDSDAITLIDAFPWSGVTTRQAAAKVPRPEVSEKEEVVSLKYDKPREQQSPIELTSGSSDSDSDAITLTDASPWSGVTTRQATAKVLRPRAKRSPTELSSGSEDDSLSQCTKPPKQNSKRRKRTRSSGGTSDQSKRRAQDQSRSSTLVVPVRKYSRKDRLGWK